MIGLPEESTEVIIRIIVASVLGGLIGLERDIHGRAAGLRTHLLVSMGAAVFMILSDFVARSPLNGAVIADPGRIAAQIIAGIGFLGAGAILKEGINVRGLTTAACLWIAAAIGMSAGGGYYVVAGGTTFIALIGLVGLKRFEKLYMKDSYRVLCVTTPLDVETARIIELVKKENVTILSCDIVRNYDTGIVTTSLALKLFHKGVTDKFAHGIIKSLETAGIKLKEIRWEHP